MDDNKLKQLKTINYQMKPTCHNCKYSEFRSDNFGVCVNNKYFHLKHEEYRELSIHMDGCCFKHSYNDHHLNTTKHFEEFRRLK